jgi:putative aldouronate transport system substrate-binding protein
MEMGYFAYGEVNGGSVYPAHARQNATAVARTCKNPDRALQVIEYIMLDNEMHNLFHYGIEGVHYELRDGIYYNLSDASPPPFKYEGFNSWNLRNGEYKLPDQSGPLLNSIFERLDAIAAKCKYPRVNIESGFQEDYTDYAAERTAVINVMAQYLAPIQAGLVGDVEASIADFLQKAETAGLQVCRDNYIKQWNEYCTEFGYE